MVIEPVEGLTGCREKERLAKEFEAATSKFAEAVAQLRLNIGITIRPEYERLQRVSDEARLKSEQARLAFEQHMVAHGC